jgi:hypothetical protein
MHPVEALLVPLGRAVRNRRPAPDSSIAHRLPSPGGLSLSSPAFDDGGVIPARYCGPLIGKEVSPPLAWSALPAGTVSLVLVVEDVDVPRSTPALHTVAVLSPRTLLAPLAHPPVDHGQMVATGSCRATICP